jgi:hypothetical protein
MMKTTIAKPGVRETAHTPAQYEAGGGAVLTDNRNSSTAIAEFLPGIDNSPPVVAQRQTIQRMLAHTGAATYPGTPVVQRKINKMNARFWALEGRLPPVLAQVELNVCMDRDLCDTLLFIDVMKTRYGKALHKLADDKIGEILNIVIRQTEGMAISRKMLVDIFKNIETKFALSPDYDESFSPTLAGRAEAREGAFTWDKKHHNFYQWIHQGTGVPLSSGALINCWEAVLALAVEAGVLDRVEAAQTYRLLEKPRATDERGSPTLYEIDIDTLFTSRQRDKISHGEGPQNSIRRDDVLVHHQPMERFHHVVIAVKPAPGDYNEVEVMSLWQQNAASFARKKLREVIRLEEGDELMICDFSRNKIDPGKPEEKKLDVSNQNE